MNTQNRSLSDIAERSQAGLPRRGMRTGRSTRTPVAREAAPAHSPGEAAPERTRPSERPQLPEPWEGHADEAAAGEMREATGPRLQDDTVEGAGTEARAPDYGAPVPAAAARAPALSIPPAWDKLGEVPLDPYHLERHRMISAAREDPSHAAFDVLRTRLLQALADNGWRRVAITSPTKNCGKSFVAANLALSLSRAETARTLLLDVDLRNPSLAKLLGVRRPGALGDLLRGLVPPEHHIVRFGENPVGVGPNLGMGLNERVERGAGELLQSPEVAAVLAQLDEVLRPDVVLYDLPPALYHDDVLAFHRHYDGVLLVVGGGITKPDEISEVSRRLAQHTPLLGVVLNRAEGPSIRDYSY